MEGIVLYGIIPFLLDRNFMRSYVRGTKAVLPEYLAVGESKAHFCSLYEGSDRFQ